MEMPELIATCWQLRTTVGVASAARVGLCPDPNDRASQETDMSLELRSRDRERKLLKKISEMLEQIESSDYGYCEKCGVEIGVQRLEARPTATQCIDCKTLDEIRERQLA